MKAKEQIKSLVNKIIEEKQVVFPEETVENLIDIYIAFDRTSLSVDLEYVRETIDEYSKSYHN